MKKLAKKGNCDFAGLFEHAESRNEIVATFLAVLELIKGRRIKVENISEDCTECNLILMRNKKEETEE